MTIIADSAWVGNDWRKLKQINYRSKVKDFSGKLMYFKPDGKFVKGYRYRQGKAISVITATNPVTSWPLATQQIKNDALHKPLSNCSTTSVLVYTGTVCPSGSATPASCTSFYDLYRITTCDNSGSSDGGSNLPGGHDGEILSPEDGGGGPGYEVTTTVEQVAVTDIVDSLTNQCFKEALHTYIFNPGAFGSMSEIGKILNFSFGLSNTWNIIFKDVPVVKDSYGNPLEASAQARYNPYNNQQIDVIVSLSDTQLADASQEYIAATILHEVMHAYFRQINPSGAGTQDHETMANNYVTKLRDALVAGFGITPNDATALAWGGLNENSQGVAITNAWTIFKNNNQSAASQIQVTNTNYKNGTKGQMCP